MKISAIIPDAMPPGGRSLAYGAFCWFNRHPGALRFISKLFRLLPSVVGRFGQVVRASAAKAVLKRPNSFSNTAHEPNLVAGDYMIGMDPGPTYADDRALIEERLKTLPIQTDAGHEAKARVAGLKTPFDLIDDYMMWVAFHAIQPVFGSAADEVAAGAGGNVNDEGLKRQYLLEIRYVAGQLLAGGLSTPRIQRRAGVCADSLRARIEGVRGDVQTAWNVSLHPADLDRNAIGLAWISHPVTVQSGALVVQELLSRPAIYRSLREMAAGRADVWTDEEFRKTVYDHVLELMRFRPIFPLLARDVPRDTEFDAGGRKNAQCRAGGKLSIWSISALFDSRAVPDSDRFCPHRKWQDDEFRWMMFGYGDRQCPARHYAVEIITSALIGLLTLPELELAEPIAYDGPLMSRMRMRVAQR